MNTNNSNNTSTNFLVPSFIVAANIVGTGLLYIAPALLVNYSLQTVILNLLIATSGMMLVTFISGALFNEDYGSDLLSMVKNILGEPYLTILRLYYGFALCLTLAFMKDIFVKVFTQGLGLPYYAAYGCVLFCTAIVFWGMAFGKQSLVFDVTSRINLASKSTCLLFCLVAMICTRLWGSPVVVDGIDAVPQGLKVITSIQAVWFFILSGAESAFSYRSLYSRHSLKRATSFSVVLAAISYALFTLILSFQGYQNVLLINAQGINAIFNGNAKYVLALIECTAVLAGYCSWLSIAGSVVLKADTCTLKNLPGSDLARRIAFGAVCLGTSLLPFSFDSAVLGVFFSIGYMVLIHASCVNAIPSTYNWLNYVVSVICLVYLWTVNLVTLRNFEVGIMLQFSACLALVYVFKGIFDVSRKHFLAHKAKKD